jgi:hypothetical protein
MNETALSRLLQSDGYRAYAVSRIQERPEAWVEQKNGAMMVRRLAGYGGWRQMRHVRLTPRGFSPFCNTDYVRVR